MQDPATPIAGPTMTRAAAAAALRAHPPGTFVCRLSLSQPGALVVTCRLPAMHPHAGAEELAHVVLGAPLLRQRRADWWLRSLPGATHVLDVYTNSRVDKRRVLESDYVRVAAVARAAAAAAAALDGGL
jgi:hypothetical protein